MSTVNVIPPWVAAWADPEGRGGPIFYRLRAVLEQSLEAITGHAPVFVMGVGVRGGVLHAEAHVPAEVDVSVTYDADKRALVFTLPGRVHTVITKLRITTTPKALETCECGTGNDAIGPGHSDWCRRYHP
jgi:hypothetical protein